MYIYLYKLKESLIQEWGFVFPKEIITNNATIKCTEFLPLMASGKVEGAKVLGKIETPFENMKVAAYTLGAISPCMRLFEVITYTRNGLTNWVMTVSSAVVVSSSAVLVLREERK